ncbi:ATP-binding protein, partial [Bacillus altitudinis]|uniref:ATP-binding protein n=1 Tax=Bacillus altitudinis TaxID=293387 RepID=UPI001F19A54D
MGNGGDLKIVIEGEKEEVMIKVKDRGEGIGEEMVKDMLVGFIRWKEKGRGVGVVVCKGMIWMYGGRMD